MGTAIGFAFNRGAQDLALRVPLSLPSKNEDPNIEVPTTSQMLLTSTGLQIEQTGLYSLSYTATILLTEPPTSAVRLSLTLNTPDNPIPGSALAARSNVIGVGETDLSSGVVQIYLSSGDLVQITPVEIAGHPTASAATLTIAQTSN